MFFQVLLDPPRQFQHRWRIWWRALGSYLLSFSSNILHPQRVWRMFFASDHISGFFHAGWLLLFVWSPSFWYHKAITLWTKFLGNVMLWCEVRGSGHHLHPYKHLYPILASCQCFPPTFTPQTHQVLPKRSKTCTTPAFPPTSIDVVINCVCFCWVCYGRNPALNNCNKKISVELNLCSNHSKRLANCDFINCTM